jgi:NAD(P)-dependent dehydrogenase (short-subunit alcohol dehydrogenase family)/acyl dehydratase
MAIVQGSEITFEQSDIDLFSKLSNDYNPLHIDAAYARRTPFGECVVYGILGVLVALRGLFKEGPVHLKALEVTFARPLFLGTAYMVESKIERHGSMTARILRGDNAKFVVRAEYETVNGPPWTSVNPSPPIAATREPADYDPATSAKECSGEYAISASHVKDLKRAIDFRWSHIHPLQLSAVCWSSYLVGMEVPGKQALFQSLSMEFANRTDDIGTKIAYSARVESFDASVSMLQISAQLSNAEGASSPAGLAKVRISAANRPPPVEYSTARLEAVTGRSSALAGKLTVVTGSSRGLGSLIALGCSLHGSNVVIHGKDRGQEIEKVAGLVTSLGRVSTICTGDLNAPETWPALASAARAQGGKVDILVSNAFPPVVPLGFGEVTDDIVEARICRVIASTMNGFRAFLPLLCEGGYLINISSEWTRKPLRHFSHYVTAKAAIEGLVLALAAEYPKINFLTVRPPRLHTDMTNDIIPEMQGQAPQGVVAAILREVEGDHGPSNYKELDTF